jgi:transcription elongation factor GreA
MREQYLTPEGAEKLRAELEHLSTVKRHELSQRLRAAIQMGDLSENADYHTAKEDQAFLEGRIQELEEVLRSAVIVKNEGNSVLRKSQVGVGATVEVQEADEKPEKFVIVGGKEADPRTNKISHESPIGRALFGKSVGTVVKVETPGGPLELKIISIEY